VPISPWPSRILCVSIFGLTACGSSHDRASHADTSTAQALVALPDQATSSTRSKKTSDCQPTGAWALCSVEKRLTQSGFVPRKVADAGQKRAGFSVAPTTYALGHSTLEVFLYADAASLARDWEKLDTLRASPRGQASAWPAPPVLVRSANLAAVFLTDSPTQADRLTLALTAGAPQPGSSTSLKRTVLPAVQIAPAAKHSR
jgi:hypothetical protein